MKIVRNTTLVVALVAVAGIAAATEPSTTTTTTRETSRDSKGNLVTWVGTVTEYHPGSSMVVRGAGNKLITYTLSPEIVVPEDVAVGKTVTVYVEPGGGTVLRKVTTRSQTSTGDVSITETTTSPEPGMINGTVVLYTPKKTIVVKDADNHEVTYTLAPDATIPAGIAVGRTVSFSTAPGSTNQISKVVLKDVTPEGEERVRTRTTETSAAGTTVTEETTIDGVVSDYQTSKSVTVERPDGSKVTYILDNTSTVPTDLAIGKRVMLRVSPMGEKRVVRRIIYSTSNN